MEIIKRIEQKTALRLVLQEEEGNLCFANNNDDLRDEFKQVFTLLNLLDYVYAVLKNKNRKIQLIPMLLPENVTEFWKFIKIGEALRMDLLTEENIKKSIVSKFPISGNNTVNTIQFIQNKLYINDNQYFSEILDNTWNFQLGNYRPLQEWLIHHQNNTLKNSDISIFKNMVIVINEITK